MRIRPRTFRTGALALICLGLVGCFPIRQNHAYTPPLAKNAPLIKRGQSTRAEVLQWFGVPDIESDGPSCKINPSGLFAQFWQTGGAPGLVSEYPHPYSSIDDQHVAYLYFEFSVRGRLTVVPFPYVTSVGVNVNVYRNKLLILINKRTWVVDEFAYRQEFNPEED